MNKNELLAQALQDLMGEVQRLNMEQVVQRSAFVLLARHLAARGSADLGELARDTERMGCTQDEPGWQDGHAEIASVLRLVHGLPSGPQK